MDHQSAAPELSVTLQEMADKWDRIADEAIADGGPITKHGVVLSAADILKLCAGDIRRLAIPDKK
jgi:hypothetical protein